MMLPNTYDETDPPDVRRDTLVDTREKVESFAHQLRGAHVMLNTMKDYEGLWNDDAFAALHDMHEAVDLLLHVCDDILVDIEDELARIQQETVDHR
jgi:hypothetical protein